jgi:hypothetical protein
MDQLVDEIWGHIKFGPQTSFGKMICAEICTSTRVSSMLRFHCAAFIALKLSMQNSSFWSSENISLMKTGPEIFLDIVQIEAKYGDQCHTSGVVCWDLGTIEGSGVCKFHTQASEDICPRKKRIFIEILLGSETPNT